MQDVGARSRCAPSRVPTKIRQIRDESKILRQGELQRPLSLTP
jgi:hypothetical protein